MRRLRGTAFPLAGLLVVGLTFGLGCASLALSPGAQFAYFGPPAPHDAWSAKIAGWQQREKADPAALLPGLPPVAQAASSESTEPQIRFATPGVPILAADSSPVDLRTKYSTFLNDRRRALAREFAAWVQAQAKQHYVADGPIDHWATLEETLKADGDDCDGLELLTFQGLRELGFAADEVFRAIVVRPSDGQHHMVTLWFESRDDPWVIDPTGAMSVGMPRMSDLPAWVPLKVFGQTEEFTVRRSTSSRDEAALAAN